MHTRLLFVSAFILTFAGGCQSLEREADDGDGYPIAPVPFTAVQLTDEFWSNRVETNRRVTIPFGFRKSEEEGRVRNFERAAGLLPGPYEGQMPFDDTDVYKIIEGASYALQTDPDPELDAYLDSLIAKIAAAQEDDGYLTTWKTIDPDTTPAWWVQPGPRWHNLGSSHELYNAGHLYEAAYAHYRATGKRNLLDVALRNADLLASIFGPDKRTEPPGHQIVETGLVKLFRATGDRKYLDLARFFLDVRGDSMSHELYGSYSQDHEPVVEQRAAVGHAVRAAYMYAGMADVAAITGDANYLRAVDAIWNDVVGGKLYITGGIGARGAHEGFGESYELPNATAYNETCAAIANIYWNHRMFLLHGDSRYIDVLERTLYNGMLAGVSLDGNTFFYPNPLESDGHTPFNHGSATRSPWFAASCCPTNVARFLPSVPDYLYAHRGDTLYVNLFVANHATVNLGGDPVQIEQRTRYPWDGEIDLQLEPERGRSFVVKIRIPGWARNHPVPGDLYRYVDDAEPSYEIRVNGVAIQPSIENGYAVIDRRWVPNDVVELSLPMPVRRVAADQRVAADSGKVALERGPIVYAAEGIDNGGHVLDLAVPDSTNLAPSYRPDLLGGVTVLTGTASSPSGTTRPFTAIPYYAWSHRGVGEMVVWMNRINI